MGKAEREQRILKKAQEIARSGRHIGWWYVAAELQFEGGEPLAMTVLDREPYRSNLDDICAKARKSGRRQ